MEKKGGGTMRHSIYFVCALLLIGSVARGSEGEISTERGRDLFESKKLGTSGKSCETCHPGGRKLEWAGTQEDGKLAATINRCIAGPIKGKPLAGESAEMQSLIRYLRSLAGM